jgi:pimeloyl-ACP methyl ester carboxylesterase
VFSDSHVEIDGRRLRYREAGKGLALVHLVNAEALALTPAHGLLARAFRVVALEVPDGARDAGAVAARALTQLGLEAFNLMATATTAPAALALALHAPARVRSIVLESPAAVAPGVGDPALQARLAEITTPTLILMGTLDDATATGVGRAYQARIPGCHLVFVYAAGAAIAAERAEAFTEIVGDFCERREAFVISRTTTLINP